jgi:hypothetical protein
MSPGLLAKVRRILRGGNGEEDPKGVDSQDEMDPVDEEAHMARARAIKKYRNRRPPIVFSKSALSKEMETRILDAALMSPDSNAMYTDLDDGPAVAAILRARGARAARDRDRGEIGLYAQR